MLCREDSTSSIMIWTEPGLELAVPSPFSTFSRLRTLFIPYVTSAMPAINPSAALDMNQRIDVGGRVKPQSFVTLTDHILPAVSPSGR